MRGPEHLAGVGVDVRHRDGIQGGALLGTVPGRGGAGFLWLLTPWLQAQRVLGEVS